MVRILPKQLFGRVLVHTNSVATSEGGGVAAPVVRAGSQEEPIENVPGGIYCMSVDEYGPQGQSKICLVGRGINVAIAAGWESAGFTEKYVAEELNMLFFRLCYL